MVNLINLVHNKICLFNNRSHANTNYESISFTFYNCPPVYLQLSTILNLYSLTHNPQPDDFSAQDITVLTLHTKDNLSLNAWYKSSQSNNPTILYLHGNGRNIGNRMPCAMQFIQAGFGILLLEYSLY